MRSNGTSSSASGGPHASQAEGCTEDTKSQAVTFTVDFGDEKPKNLGKMPKQLSSARYRNKQKLSQEVIATKQRLAEERRKVK